MIKAFAAGAGAAFAAFLGFLLTLGGIVVAVKWALRSADAAIGRNVRSAVKFATTATRPGRE